MYFLWRASDRWLKRKHISDSIHRQPRVCTKYANAAEGFVTRELHTAMCGTFVAGFALEPVIDLVMRRTTMSMSNQGASSSSGNFPLDNLTYDLITILYEKSKGLEAYDKYQRDAQGNQQVSQLLQQMRQQDEQHVRQLQQLLAQQLGH